MSRVASNFREADVRRAVRAVESAGHKVARVEIEGRKIVIVPTSDAPADAQADEWAISNEGAS